MLARALMGARQPYPVLKSITTQVDTSDATSRSVALPSGISSGDLLLAFVSVDGSATTVGFPSGWVESNNAQIGAVSSTARALLFSKWATGSEGSTATVTTSALETVSIIVYRISGAANFNFSIFNNTTALTTADPPSHTDSNSSSQRARLWIAAAHSVASLNVSSWPSGYSNTTSASQDNLNNLDRPSVFSASKSSYSEAEDPGAFTLTAARVSYNITLAIN